MSTPIAVVYVAGPYRGPHAWAIAQHVRAAETVALDVWRHGMAALCPHANTAHFQDTLPDATWLAGDLALLAKCDAVLLMPDWLKSEGAMAEREFAIAHGIPVFQTLKDLIAWRDAAVVK